MGTDWHWRVPTALGAHRQHWRVLPALARAASTGAYCQHWRALIGISGELWRAPAGTGGLLGLRSRSKWPRGGRSGGGTGPRAQALSAGPCWAVPGRAGSCWVVLGGSTLARQTCRRCGAGRCRKPSKARRATSVRAGRPGGRTVVRWTVRVGAPAVRMAMKEATG